MKIYGMEKLSLVDYDGKVAATLFTGSCNFRCGFCHNAALVVDFDSIPALDETEIFAYLKKRKGILDGVCISGGEPTLNKDLPDFCAKIKSLGYPIKLDTNGTNPSMVETLHREKLVDYFAMDIKNCREEYGTIIGMQGFDTSLVEKTAAYLMRGGGDYEFRTTLIREYHNEENIKKIGEWIKGAKKYFMQKFKNGDNCLTQNLNEVDTADAVKFKKIMEEYVTCVELRGYDL